MASLLRNVKGRSARIYSVHPSFLTVLATTSQLNYFSTTISALDEPFVREAAPHGNTTRVHKNTDAIPRSNYSGNREGNEGKNDFKIDYRERTEAARRAGPSGAAPRYGRSSSVQGYGRSDGAGRNNSFSSNGNRFSDGYQSNRDSRSTESRASTPSTSRYPSSSSPASLSPRQSFRAPSSSSSSPSDYDRSSSRPYPVKEPSVRTSTSFEQRDAPNIFDRFSRRDNNSDPSSNRDVPPSRYDGSRAARPATSLSRSAPSYDRQEARRDNYASSRPSASNPNVPIASAPVSFRAIGSSGRTNDRSSFSDSANAAYDNRPRYPDSSSSSPSPSRPTPSSYANRESTQSTFRGSAAPIRSLDTRSSESSRMRAPAPSRHTSRYDDTLPPPSRLPLADAPTPTLETIDPSLLSDLRLSMMNSSGRIPTRTEMESGLTKWLEKERVKERATLAKAASRLRLEEWRGIQLDQAWVWKREKEIELGIVATEDDLQRDERVARRMRMRKEDEHQASLQSLQRDSPASRVQSYAVDPDRKLKEARRAAGLPEEGAVKKYARPAVDTPSSSSAARKEREEEPRPANPPAWLAHRYSQRESFPEGWEPPKRVSREALSLIRLLQQSDPTKFTVPVLADRFKISPEAIRRILKSRFELDSVESDRREGVRKQLRKTNLARVREEEGEGSFRTSWAGDTEGEKSEMDRISRNNTRDGQGVRFAR